MGILTDTIRQAGRQSAAPSEDGAGVGQIGEREQAIIDRHKNEAGNRGSLFQDVAQARAEREIGVRRQQRAYAEKPTSTLAQITVDPTREMVANLGDRAKVLDTYRKLSPEQREEALRLAPGIAQQLGDDRGGAVGRTLGAVSRGVSHMVAQPAMELAGELTGTDWGGTPEEIEFIRQLDAAASQEFSPARPGDPWYEKGPLQAAEMAPWMATTIGGGIAGSALAKTGGQLLARGASAGVPGARTAFQAAGALGRVPKVVGLKGATTKATMSGVGTVAGMTAAGFPSEYAQEVDQLKELGMEDNLTMRLLAGGTAVVASALEGIVPNPLKAGPVPLTQGAVKAARQYLWNAAKQAPGEISEEYLQGVTSGLGAHIAQYLDENAEDKSIAEAFQTGYEQAKEAALPMAFLLGVPAIGGAASAGRLARLQAIRAKGFVSESDAKEAGIDGKNRKERLANIEKAIEQEAAAPSSQDGSQAPQYKNWHDFGTGEPEGEIPPPPGLALLDKLRGRKEAPPSVPPALPPVVQPGATPPALPTAKSEPNEGTPSGVTFLEPLRDRSLKDIEKAWRRELEVPQTQEAPDRWKMVDDIESNREARRKEQQSATPAAPPPLPPGTPPALLQGSAATGAAKPPLPTETKQGKKPPLPEVPVKPGGEAGAAVAGAGQGIVGGLYQSMFDRLQKGKYPGIAWTAAYDAVAAEHAKQPFQSSDEIQQFVNKGTRAGVAPEVEQLPADTAPQAPAEPPQTTPKPTVVPEAKVAQAAQEKEPASPEWDVIQAPDRTGRNKLYREDPNPNLTPSQRRATRQEVDPSEVVLITKDFQGKPIPKETMDARKEFVDKAKPGTTFRRPNFNKNALFEVGKDGKISSIESTTKRPSGSVQELANMIKPGDVTWTTQPSAGPSEGSAGSPTVSPDAPATPETRKGEAAGEGQSSEASAGKSKQSPRVYREMAADELDMIINPSTSSGETFGGNERFWSDNPDLAIGQGSNKGFVVELDPSGLDLKEHAKPATAIPGVGKEFTTRHRAGEFRPGVRSITVKPGQSTSSAIRVKRFLEGEVKAGRWTKSKTDSGGVRYSPVAEAEAVVSEKPVTSVPFVETYDDIDKLPKHSVYQRDFRGQRKFMVRSDGERGGGDGIFDTEQEAREYASVEIKREQQRDEATARREQREAEEAKKEADYVASFKGFRSDSPMAFGKAKQALEKQVRYRNKVQTRKQIVEQAVADGAVVKDGDRLEYPDGEFLDVANITKTGLDYAEHLISQKQREQSSKSPPESKWQSETRSKLESVPAESGWKPAPKADVSIIESPGSKLETSRQEKKDPQFPITAGSPVTVYRRGKDGKEEMQEGVVEDFADHMPGNIKVRLSDGTLATPFLVDVGPRRKPQENLSKEKIPVASANIRIQQLQDTFSLTHEQAVAADALFDAVSLPGEVEIAPPGTPTPEDRLTQKQLAKESKQHLADESPTTYRELSSSEIPTQTQRAFKLIKRYKSRPGLLYPLFVGASEGGFRKGKWYAAEVKQPRIGSKDLARRPGIHAVDLPIFAQGKPAAKGQDRVWVEVEMPAVSPETQKESDQSTVLSNGMRTGITSRLIGTKEAYDYKTNPNAQGANAWPIAGSMKIVRVLSDSDVEDVLRKAGKGEWIGRSLSGESVEAAADWNSLYQKQLDQQGAIQAWTTFVSASKAIIGATDKADVSSFFHEFGHPMRRFLFDRSVPQEKRGNITDEDIRTIEDFVGVKNGQWNTDAEEKFVDAHMTYLMEGKAPTKKLETVFQKIAKWLSDVLSVIERKVSLSPDVRAIFDKVYKRGVTSDTKKPQPQKPDLSTIVDKTDAEAEQSEFDDAALKALDDILQAEEPPKPKASTIVDKTPPKAKSGQFVLPGMPGMAAEVDRQDFVRRHRDDALGRLWGWSDSPADAQDIQGAIDAIASDVGAVMNAIYSDKGIKNKGDVFGSKEYQSFDAAVAAIDNEPIPGEVILNHIDNVIDKALEVRPKPRTLKKPRNSEQTMAEAKSDLQVAHDAAAKLMEKIRSKLMSGVDPELMAETVQVAYLYTKAGIKTFKGYVEAVVESFGDSFAREFAPYMESGWRALYTRNVVTDPAGKVNDYLTEVSDERDTGPTRDVDGASGARTEALEASEAEASGIANTERPPDAGDGGSGGLAGDGGRSEVTGDESPGGTERSDEDVRLPAGPGGNYRIGADERVGGGAGRGFSAKARFTENVKAIRLLKTLEKEGRKATAEEQSVLVKYVGWGGLKQAFGRGKLVDGKTVYQPIKGYESEFTQLRDLLTDEEWQSAKKSITNAHYTDPAVIRGMWQGLVALGFKGGKIVEPSAGTGLFFGHIPQAILDNPSTRLAATEIDSVSGRIAQQLYQGADVRVQGFEELNLPDNSVDLFISNVPFGRNQLSDKKDRSIKKAPIHNFFFNKAIRKTRPGGLVAFITSRYSMDEKDASTREFWDKSGANLVGVVRLPGGAFKGIANTDVVTDIIILQKREDGAGPVHAAPWKKRKNVPQTGYLELVRRKDGPGKIKVRNEGDTAFPVNEYFEAHPENIVGELAWTGTMQKVDENQVNVEAPETGDIGDRVNEIIADLPVNKESLDRVAVMTEEIDNADMEAIKSGEWQDDHLRVEEGRIFLNHFGNRVEVPMPYGRHKKGKDGEITEIVPNEKGAERMTAIIKVFNAAERLIALQPTNASDKQIEAARLKLNKVYDAAVKKFGPLSSGWNATFSRTSLTVASRVFSLEEYNPTTDTAQKAAIFTERTERPHTFPTKAENAQDALTISLSQVGSLDPSHTANLLGKPVDSTMEELGNLVFKNHDGEWELASTYLSGNVRKKLAEAKALAEDNDSYRRNVESLEAVQPEDLTPSQIEVRLGSPWIPTDVYEQFLAHLLRREVKVSHSQAGGKWFLTPESRARNDQLETLDWGIARMPALDIITKSLNRGDMRVWEPDGHGGRVVNRDDTTQVAAKLTKIKAEFGRWIWDNPERVDRLTGLYNQEVNNIHQEPRDGSHLTFPGMSEDVRSKLDAHQVNAVWRYLTGGNMLLAHVVGAGKSWVMAASAMEQKRISGNPSYKTMIAVPNHLVTSGQFVKEIYEAYPSAKVLAATPDSLSGIGRRSLLKKMATGNYDIVVIAHSSFGKIPLNPTHEADFIQKQIDDLEVEVRTARADSDRSYEAELQAMIDNLRDKLSDMSAALQRDELSTYFDELNIDSLFVDEAHEFKNLAFRTRMSRVPGVNPTGSNMAFDMWMKTTYFNKATNEKNLMFATGTPIANAIAEMYTMQRYLQPSELARLGLEHFDSWAAAFADEVTKPEIDPAGGGMRMHSRLAQYINMPELSAIFRQVADVQTADMLVDVLKRPAIKGGSPQAVKAERNAILEEIIEGLQERAQRVRGGMVDKSEDNMLNIVTDGRKAATDIRLIDPSYPDLKGSKVNLAVENIHRIWEDTSDKKSTQIVWLDVTSPNTDYPFNLYHEIVDKLAALGIPRDEIAIMHDYNEKTKSQLFRSMNKGDVRILLGSTAVMGTGVNVQKRLIASHHLDVPWRPDQLEQRDGRILRRGNTNKEVEIIRYISKGSFDSFMWDKIEQKSSFIRAAMSGASDRILDASEAEDMSAAEMKAAAADDPSLIRFVTVQAEVNKLESEHRGFLDQQSQIRQGIATAHRNVEFYTQRASNFESMIEAQESLDIPEGEVRAKIGNTSFTDSKEFGKALTDALVNAGKEDVYFEYNGFKGATHKIGEGWIDKSLRSVGWLGSQATNVDLELSDSPTGNITRLNNAIAKIKGQPEYYRDQVEQNRLKIPALEKRIQAGWPDADKLSELRQEQATLAGLVQSSGSDEHKQEIARRIEQQTARKVLISGETGQYLWEGVEVATDKSKNAAQNEAVAVVPPNIVDAAEGQLTAERNRDREARLRKLREEAELYEWDRTVSPRPPKKKTTRKKSTNPAASSAGAVGESRSLDAFTSPDLQNRQSMGAARRRVESAADLVGDDTGASDSRYASSDSEFEQRWQRAAKGISKQSLAGKLREFWQELVKSTVRGSLPELPRTEQFGEARSAMHAYQNAPTYAQIATADLLKKTSKPLSASDYDLFTRVVIMRDQVEAASKGERLSYGLTPEKAQAELDRVEALAADNERVQASLEYRKQWTEAMVNDFLAAHEYLGLDMSDRFKRENYFRHQVLYYAEAKQRGLGKKKVELTPNRGWLKGRTSGEDLGEAFDINANYLQAEWEVSTQMIADTKRAQAIGRLKRHYDKMRQLKEKAKYDNYVAVVGGPENMQEIEELRGKIDELRAMGSLDSGEKAQIKAWSERIWELDPTMEFRQRMAIARDQIERGAAGLGEDASGDFMRYVSSLAKRDDSPLQPPALEFLKAVSDRKKFIQNALGDKYETWEDVVPDDHEEVAIRPGRAMFQAYSVPEQVASELMADLSKTLGISAEDLRPLTALGSKYTPLVVPQEVAAQMAAIDNKMDFGWLDHMVTRPMNAWKRWALMGPTRFIKYNLRNLSEIDKVMSLNPAALKDIPQAIRDLWKLYSGADDIPATVRDWAERGGTSTLVRVNELGELNELKAFARLISDKRSGVAGKVIKAPVGVWRIYWSAVSMGSDFRESILRYAAYLNYVKQLEAGKLTNYGGSVRAEVDGIKDIKDKAMRLSADLLGDYSDISQVGQFIRSRIAPFWPFQETNVRTYSRGLINLASNEQTAIKAGMAVARAAGIGGLAKTPFLAYKLGRIAILFYGFKALTTAFNQMLFPDDDDELTDEEKRKAHLTFGKNSKGEVQYFSRIGTAADVLDWVGLDSVDYDLRDVLDGRRTIRDVLNDMARSPVDKAYGMLSPFMKVPTELAVGQTAYPSVGKPRPIRDRGRYIAQNLGLQKEYDKLVGNPSTPYSVTDFFLYKVEPGTAAYYMTLDAKFRWLKTARNRGVGYSESARGNALRNYKMAQRLKDQVAVDKYLAEYEAAGGTKDGLMKSLEWSHPAGGLSTIDAYLFYKSLAPVEQDEYRKAEMFYYSELLTEEQAKAIRATRDRRLRSLATGKNKDGTPKGKPVRQSGETAPAYRERLSTWQEERKTAQEALKELSSLD